MTDKQTAIEALDKIRIIQIIENHLKWIIDRSRCQVSMGKAEDMLALIPALKSNVAPVDVEALRSDVLGDIRFQSKDCYKLFDHLHAKGHLNTPQTEDTE